MWTSASKRLQAWLVVSYGLPLLRRRLRQFDVGPGRHRRHAATGVQPGSGIGSSVRTRS